MAVWRPHVGLGPNMGEPHPKARGAFGLANPNSMPRTVKNHFPAFPGRDQGKHRFGMPFGLLEA
jgi:hypothetical protein